MSRFLRALSPFFPLVALGLASCGADAGADEPVVAHEPTAAPAPEPSSSPSPPSRPETVAVAHTRELRAAWVYFVWNGVWPSKQGLTQAEAKAELVTLFDGLAAANMNAVFFQVRTEGDAVYPSALAPWTRWLSGTMGEDPGWDPLAFTIELAHQRGIELHAWMNPYRALSSTSIDAPAKHVTKRRPAVTVRFGSQIYLDPAAPEVREEMRDVVAEVLQRYDVDGIHFDDYFYPYPVANTVFDDSARYTAYVQGGGTLEKRAWRRENVNALVRDVSELVADMRPDVRFGISPFGIYKPGVPEGITGLDAYNEIACDPVTWIENGWVDYLVPQLYWPTTREAQSFVKLVTWWAGLARDGHSVFIGHDVTRLGEAAWPLSEIELQMDLSRAERDAGKGLLGNVFFTGKEIARDHLGLRTSLVENHWKAPTTTPPLASVAKAAMPLPSPTVTRDGRAITVAPPVGVTPRAYAVYDASVTPPSLARLVPARPVASGAREAIGAFPPGRWAVSVVDRRGLESLGVRVDVE